MARAAGEGRQSVALMKLLIVDDDRALRDALRRVLNLAGYEVVCAEGGLEALGQVSGQAPDGVVLDIGLPDVSGLEVCRRLRSAGQRLPVLRTASTASTPGRTTTSPSRSTSAS